MPTQRHSTANANRELIAINVAWLRQALSLVRQIDDASYARSPENLAPHRAGAHLRHILEFYECFLNGLGSLNVDYDARQRDERIETSRQAAMDKITAILERLETEPLIRRDSVLFVRMEDASANLIDDPYLCSTVGRELQALSSHTIHHFALIAITLRAHGVSVDPDFGMAPSTLRFRSSQAFAARSEAA